MKTPIKLKLIIVIISVLSCNNDDNLNPQETKSSAKQILSFSFLSTENASLITDIVATIDETTKSINATVPSGTDVSALYPKIIVSEQANFGPSGAQNFSTPIDFIVNAEDGSQVIYTATIVVNEGNEAVLENINPSEGPKGTIVTISGSNFGLDLNEVSVFFNEAEAVVQSVTDTEIIAEVPPRAYTGVVKVIKNGLELTGPIFTYTLSEVIVSTLAGNGNFGFADGFGDTAQFKAPTGVAVDASGTIYVADALNHKIRKITSSGEVSTLAGSTEGFADGASGLAQFKVPTQLTIDNQGMLYVSDTENNRIRKITVEGVVSTLAGSSQGNNDGSGANARFILPTGITIDTEGSLYVVDTGNNRIRKITDDGNVSTFAGSTRGFADAIGTAAKFDAPTAVTINNTGALFVSDWNNHTIRKISPNAEVSTLTGNTKGYTEGDIAIAQFNNPTGIAIDGTGIIYIVDSRNHRIRKITAEGVVSTLAGGDSGFADGSGDIAQFNVPSGIAIDADGIIYVADEGNHRIRKIIQE